MRIISGRGSVLLALLLILPLIAASTFYLQRLQTSSAEREQIVNRTVRDSTEGLIPPIRSAVQLDGTMPSSGSPFLLFDGLLQTSAYLLRINGPMNLLPRPSWNRLSSLPEIDCSSIIPDLIARATRASSTCSGLIAPITLNSLSPYNVDQQSLFSAQSTSNSSLIIAIGGEFRAPLNLTLGSNSRIELIVLGPIEISTLTINAPSPNSNSSVLLYSGLGSITVTQLSGANLCDTGSAIGTKVRLEAVGEIRLAGSPPTGPAAGCEVTRSADFWPKSQVLGVYYQ